jgi:AAA domain
MLSNAFIAGGYKARLLADADHLADDSVPDVTPDEPATRIRTAAQRLMDARNAPELRPLFGGLWETPGIAILAGDTGVGKSVLAVHIAHLITSDTPTLLGLPCGVCERLLYYDFELTDRQFEKRFERFPFTDELLTGDTNPAAVDVESFTFDDISADLDRTGAEIVVLDNISALALKTTADADVSIGIMKGLKRLQLERGVSSLVLAHTPKLPSGVALSLNHLAGSKHLSNFADSVFFVGRSVQGPGTRYVKQVKNRTGEMLPGVLVCKLSDESGHLGFSLLGPDDEAPHLAVPVEENPATPRKAPLTEVLGELPMCLARPQPAGQLETQLSEHFATDARTIRKRLKDLTDSGAGIVDLSGQLCTIHKEQKGRETWYSLRLVAAPT